MMDKRIKQTIENILRERPNISMDEAIDIVKTYAEKPDPVKLENQYYRRIVNGILASFKDENNVRECFSIKDDNGDRFYINVGETTNQDHLKSAKETIASRYRGLNKSLKKISARELELRGQQSFSFDNVSNMDNLSE